MDGACGLKKKQFKAQRKRIRRLAKKWIRPLGLGGWNIRHHYYDSSDNFLAAVPRAGDEPFMTCRADWKYGWAVISVNCAALVGRSDAVLEWCYLHELGHVFLSELGIDPDGKKAHHEEHVATVLAKAFVWLRGADDC